MSAESLSVVHPPQQLESYEERFVPASASLIDDAPGWLHDPSGQKEEEKNKGPVCWKCRGSGKKKMKISTKKKKGDTKQDDEELTAPSMRINKSTNMPETTFIDCTVCQGMGYLPPKKSEMEAMNRPGEITRARACPDGWKPDGPPPRVLVTTTTDEEKSSGDNDVQAPKRPRNNSPVLSNSNFNQELAQNFLRMANTSTREVAVILPTVSADQSGTTADKNNNSPFRTEADPIPSWLPQPGEQLCNLVGQWRILQRIGSHRWTTDDLVCSYLAGRVWNQEPSATQQGDSSSKRVRYMDLGCGNGSVLLMTTWQLMKQQQQKQDLQSPPPQPSVPPLLCLGIEARKEALELARRSIDFNVGDQNPQALVQILHGDFRELPFLLKTNLGSAADNKFDLVTGTPPYFRVDFTVEPNRDQNHKTDGADKSFVVTKAVINQGGMPSCKQSAPARCEFRGGVEAYCIAAASQMADNGMFCVTENWLNDDRVYQGAQQAGLVITQVLPVRGRSTKPAPLFAVYVMRKAVYFTQSNITPPTKPMINECLDVRDDKGQWTEEYQKVLQTMSIPVLIK